MNETQRPLPKVLRPAKPDPFEQFARGEEHHPRDLDEQNEQHYTKEHVDPPEKEVPPATLDQRAASIVEQATVAIVENIDALISRANRLKQSIIEDTADVKFRITANLNHGAKILELSKRIDSELDELEEAHKDMKRKNIPKR